ncbi:MAG: hypothetical protein LBM59_01670 [Ruminococcus sp.]|nr:hypothetical protein [Ruminococcus sp.]
MGATFDITVIGAELLELVVFMDNSPAYMAFSEEIVKILSEFNKTGIFGMEIDTAALVDSSKDTLTNMQRAFLCWTFNNNDTDSDRNYFNYLKLFCKSQEKYFIAANDGSPKITVTEIPAVKQKYLNYLSTNPESFIALKDFFAGYIYGYFFNYISEQLIMRDYAELLVCLGIMSNKIPSSGTASMKMLPRMSKLLENDRFKYISGELPLSLVLDIITGRFNLTGISDRERLKIRSEIQNIITVDYEDSVNDDLIRDNIICELFEKLGKEFVSAPAFADSFFRTCFGGIRTFTDGDREDFGIFTPEYITELINKKCNEDFDSSYSDETRFHADYSLSGSNNGFLYPLITKSAGIYHISEIYLYNLFPALHDSIYIEIDENDLPLSMYQFSTPAFKTDVVRTLGGLPDSTFVIRKDKKDLVDRIKATMADDTGNDAKMYVLELLLPAVSGNMDAASYNRFVIENLLATKLFEKYVRFRAEKVIKSGLSSIDSKKALLDKINSLI